ncbi:ABC transporter ATP-binding protein [Ferroglobus sp.]|uniref:ABC transporter ATP-binding protein n=1 Tax=Ferroglobus sp. TaxID=2614230 RepID=UPI0025C444F2|nr:ABC transporter ATP-binding protein [Ferroglobus sp.]
MLEARDLESGYGEMQVLWGVNIKIDKGSITTILGANGVGKTTTLKTIFGIIKPWKGTVTFKGEDVTLKKRHEKVEMGIAYVPEGRHLFPLMTVEENLRLGAYTKRAEERLEENLSFVYDLFPILKERRKQRAGTLSGGEQQMLTIARALMSSPELILMDEPSQGLAPKVVHDLFDVIKKLREEGLTILLVEQNVYASLEIADYVYLMSEGRIFAEGRRDELSEEEIRKAYVGV